MRMPKILIASQILLLSSWAFSQQHSPVYSVTIKAAPQHVKSTNDVLIDIQIKNISKGPITCQRGPVSGALDIAFQYDVRTADGHVIPRNFDPHPELGAVSHGWPCLLQPGETARSVAFVGQFYDMRLPGRYLIQISQSDCETHEVVKSNQIEVTVDP
jgi:hypothetical protein